MTDFFLWGMNAFFLVMFFIPGDFAVKLSLSLSGYPCLFVCLIYPGCRCDFAQYHTSAPLPHLKKPIITEK